MRTFSVLLVFVLVFGLFAKSVSATESVYDRVIRTSTIRCGYITGAPYLMKDPKTGNISGIWYEYVEELGRQLGLKINWAEEVGLGDFPTALDANRVDMMCVGLWVSPARAKATDFITPITFQIVEAYVRAGDKRFDDKLEAINKKDVTVSCIDGEMAQSIAAEDFPKAKQLCMPQLTPFADMMLNLTSRKADITFASPAAIRTFNAANPDKKLEKVKTSYPLRVFPESMPVKRGEEEFRRMIDHVTGFLLNTGKIETILHKYETESGGFHRVAKPYQ